MKKYFSESGLNVSDDILNKFEIYYSLLIEYNLKFNITAITDKEEVIKKHFIDSIYPFKLINSGDLIDVGAGGGFPSVPLKIMNDGLRITLLESTGKKCEFLKVLIKELNIKNAEVINGRAEDVAKNLVYREKFDFAVSRAVARLNTLSEYCLPFVKTGGKFIAYKGDAETEISESVNAVNLLGGKINRIDKYELFGLKRTLVFIDKIKRTDKKYPRGNGKERKNPL